jgi:hypothetical protein
MLETASRISFTAIRTTEYRSFKFCLPQCVTAMVELSSPFHITNGMDQLPNNIRLQICMHAVTAYEMCWIGSMWDIKYIFIVMVYYHSKMRRLEQVFIITDVKFVDLWCCKFVTYLIPDKAKLFLNTLFSVISSLWSSLNAKRPSFTTIKTTKRIMVVFTGF